MQNTSSFQNVMKGIQARRHEAVPFTQLPLSVLVMRSLINTQVTFIWYWVANMAILERAVPVSEYILYAIIFFTVEFTYKMVRRQLAQRTSN